MMLSRSGLELNEIWMRQSEALSESNESPEQREARVLKHHSDGNHYEVVKALHDSHHSMSDKERKAYDVSAKALHPTVPRHLHGSNDHHLGDALVRWTHYPSEHPALKKAYDSMDTESKMAHATHVAHTWHKLKERNADIDDDGYLTVYRRPTKQDTSKGFKGRDSGDPGSAKEHDWGGSSWSLNPWHVGRDRGHRPGLKTRVHHSQVLGHPFTYDWHKRIGNYQRENEVVLKPNAKVKAEPCGGDPKQHAHLDNCHDHSPEKVDRLQRDAVHGRYPGSKSS